ncbi:MAG: HAD family hydrolase [Prochloraceae cyanobacterium]|nr:HAD family hydrolase [Prochloraceae cyanobacterium]
MFANNPDLLALDFDGVICDGLIEYFLTTKKTYCQVWNPPEAIDLDRFTEKFYKLRPVIETGWEMPVLLRAIVKEIAEDDILQKWPEVRDRLVESEALNPKDLAYKLDTVRDKWIATDLEEWLDKHRFFPGIIDRLNNILNSQTILYIVTTKEGRFTKRILQKAGIELESKYIIGKECQRPKYETLRLLISSNSEVDNVWFVEDRLKTLKMVQQQPDLQQVKLFLAAWGYNTQQARESVSYGQNIKLISLEQFSQGFSSW